MRLLLTQFTSAENNRPSFPTSKLAEKADKKFTKYQRAYSIDVGFENKEPKLIELNSQPGLFSNTRGSGFVRFKEKLANTLLDF